MTEIMRVARRLAEAEKRLERIRDERDELIAEAHAQGESPKLLATAAGVSENTIFKILRARRR